MSLSLTENSSCSSDNHAHDHDNDLQRLLKQEEIVTSLLAKHNGSTKNPQVIAAINKLASMNPTEEVASSPLLEGEFLCHTLPEFPGRLKNAPPGTVQYSLGRLSFGIFQPHHLVCTVRSVRQSIHARSTVKDAQTGQVNRSKFQTFDYPICLDLTIHTPKGDDLPAIMYHGGVCYKDIKGKHPQRLTVTFKGSTLMPAHQVRKDPKLLQIWQDTFHNAYKTAEKERTFWTKAIQMAMKWWFQMVLPNDDDAVNSEDYSVNFQMKRSPRGYLDFLYLSERLRVTRGNRGTLVVVERMTPTTRTSNN